MANAYHLLPLDNSKQQIRLLRLEPGACGEPLKGSLEVIDLQSGIKYEALSYTWGPTHEGNVITLNGDFALPITENLSIALQRLRHRLEARIMWVDAICIAQSDAAERSSQVLLMGELYACATRVCVWLGNDTGSSARQERKILGHLDPDKITSRYSGENLHRVKSLRRFANMLHSALRQTTSPWYTRAWIYQEYLKATNIMWCCGRYQQCHTKDQFARLCGMAYVARPSDELARLRDGMDRLNRPMVPVGIGAPKSKCVLYGRCKACATTSIHAHAYAARGMQAELASDKVYSLYGVNGFSGAFPPDYSQPCWWAYAQATYASISKYRDFSVLLNAKRITHLDAVPNLPTWAFDYSSGMYYSFPESVGEAMLATLRGAQPSLPRLSADHSTLYLSGLLRGEIDCTGRVTFNETEGDRKYSRSDFFRAFTNALNRQLIDPNAEDYLWPLSETRTHFTLDGQFLLDLRARRFIMEKCRISSPMPDDDDEWAQSINFFATAGGLSGIMPTSCAVGDYVFVTRYCPYPLILRQRDQGWVFQGCAYIPALLYGYVEIFSAYQVTTVGIM